MKQRGQGAVELLVIAALAALAIWSIMGWEASKLASQAMVANAPAAAAVIANDHAVQRHPNTWAQSEQCFAGAGEILGYAFNPKTGNKCIVGLYDGKYHLDITTDNGQQVTLICKDKMNCIWQVLKYLRNAGYLW